MQLLFTLILPFVASLVSYALQKAKYPAKTNTIIASCTILVAMLIRAFLEGKLDDNAIHDVEIVLGMSTALQSETFASLQQYLRNQFPTNSTPPSPTRPTVTDWTKGS